MSVEEDVWEDNSSTTVTIMQRVKQNKPSVRDSWDEDEDEDESLPDPKLIWEQEIIRDARAPMPQIQLSTTTVVSGVLLPPPAAFKEPLKILKRPESTRPKSSTSSPPPHTQSMKSLKEREAQYRAARERIFGDKETEREEDASTVSSPPPFDGTRSTVVRDPIGPSASGSNFQQRRRKAASPVIRPPDSEKELDAANVERING